MRISTVLAVALLLAACAASSPREDLSDQSPALSPQPTASPALASSSANVAERVAPTPLGPVTEVFASPNDGALTGVVCEVRKRPGSRVKERVCMLREAHNAIREAARDRLSAAQREHQWLEEVTREAETERRRGGGFGPGP